MNSGVETLVNAVQELSLARNIESVQHIVRKAARQIAGADGATFIFKDGTSCFYADEDAIGPLWKGQRFPVETCISGWAMMNRKQVVIEDIYVDNRIPIEAYRPTFVKSLVMVPIRSIDPIGAIGNYWAEQRIPTDDELKLLQSLADITAVTLENIKVYNEMEQRVKDRTAELEALNKELQAFTYSVSHDLHAPLRAVNNYVTMLAEKYNDKLGEEGIIITDRIVVNVNDMRQLIDDLLSFFRMEQTELIKTEVPMKELATDVFQNIIEQENKPEIQLVISELPSSIAEASLMKQVWVNLISNAVKYSSRKEKAVIEIGFEDQKDHVVYFIKDNGAGFDMKYYDKMFGVFQRLHAKTEFEGSGIGLATTKKIILKHKGNIWAEGKVNEGAMFSFSLPKISVA